MLPMKKCTGCNEIKALDKFHKQGTMKDDLRSRCKECGSAANRKYRIANPEKGRASNRKYQAANRDKAPASSRKWNAANTDKVRADNSKWRAANREKVLADGRAYRVANPEYFPAAMRKYRTANPDKVRAANRKWAKANPEVSQLKNARRRASKKESGIFRVAPKEIKGLLAQPCYLCGVAPSTTIDHIIPVIRGGRHSIGNLIGACKPCNSSKLNKYLVEYRQYQRGLTRAKRSS